MHVLRALSHLVLSVHSEKLLIYYSGTTKLLCHIINYDKSNNLQKRKEEELLAKGIQYPVTTKGNFLSIMKKANKQTSKAKKARMIK